MGDVKETVQVILSAEITDGDDTLTATVRDDTVKLAISNKWDEQGPNSISVSISDLSAFVDRVLYLVDMSKCITEITTKGQF